MRILVDGDATPSINLIEKISQKYNLEMIIYVDTNHIINSEYSTVIIVDTKSQSVDIKLANDTKNGDIVITADYGVALISLTKGAYCVNPSGFIYTKENIDNLLLNRHINSKIRKSGGRVKGPKKRTKENDEKLIKCIKQIIKEDGNDELY